MKRLLGAGMLSLLVAAACGGSSDDGGGGSATDCASATKAICEHINSCFPYLVKASYGDVATCAARTKVSCETDLAAPGNTTTPAQIGACATAWSHQACDLLLTSTRPAECMIGGTRKDGEACGTDGQCQSTQCKKGNGECGTCGPRSAAGESCTSTDDCQAGLTCANDVCATPVPAGGSCTGGDQCLGSQVCKNGTCAKAAGVGEACDPQKQDCDFTQGLYCDGQSKLCAAVAWANTGEACGLINGKYTACSQGSCQNGTCAALAADGAACDETNGPDCEQPAKCVNKVCKLPAPASCG